MAATYRSLLCDEIRFLASHHGPALANGPTLPGCTREAGYVGDLEFHHRCPGEITSRPHMGATRQVSYCMPSL